MPYDITLVSKCGFSLSQLETAISALQTEILSDGDARVTSLTTPAMSISFGDNGPLRTELLRAMRYALWKKDPTNPLYTDAQRVTEVQGVIY
jgi:hypothetical protein